MTTQQRNNKPQTILSQPLRQAPQYIATVQPPLYRASTIIFPDTDALINRHWTDEYDYSYGTHGTPTTYSLADQVKHIETANHCILAPSGLSAINLVNSALLNSGDEVWIPDNIYSPNHDHLMALAEKYHIHVKVYDACDTSSIQFSNASKLIWIEAAGSVTLEFPDVLAIVQKAKQANVLTAFDHTWGAGLAFNPFQLGDMKQAVDISVHALTKYPSGGADILMGSICTLDKSLHTKILKMHALQGIAISGDDAAQVSRSLPSMALRYQQHHQTTLGLIDFLQQREELAQVLHPSIVSHAGHEHWLALCPKQLAAGIVSIIFKPHYSLSDIQQFCNTLQLFHLGFSWGGPTSLVMYYDLKQIRQMKTPHLSEGYLVRLCIGLEDKNDLIRDLEHAFSYLKSD